MGSVRWRLPIPAPFYCMDYPGNLLPDTPEGKLEPAPDEPREEKNSLTIRLLAAYAWLSWLLFHNGLSCPSRAWKDFRGLLDGEMLLIWGDIEKGSEPGYAKHIADLRNIVARFHITKGQTPSRGLKRLQTLLDWPDDAVIGKEIAIDVISMVYVILDNLDHAWTTDRGKLLIRAEDLWAQKDSERRQLALDALSVHRIRWPGDAKASKKAKEWKGANIEEGWEEGLLVANAAIKADDLQIAEGWLCWAAVKTPPGSAARLRAYHQLSVVRLVREIRNKGGLAGQERHSELAWVLENSAHNPLKRVSYWLTENVTAPAMPEGDPAHPHCAYWSVRVRLLFAQAKELASRVENSLDDPPAHGQVSADPDPINLRRGMSDDHRRTVYRLLYRARRAFECLPELWRDDLRATLGSELERVFAFIERRNRILCLEAMWWRGLKTKEAKWLRGKLRDLEQARQEPEPVVDDIPWFPKDEDITNIPFALLDDLPAFRDGASRTWLKKSAKGISYRELARLSDKRLQRLRVFLRRQEEFRARSEPEKSGKRFLARFAGFTAAIGNIGKSRRARHIAPSASPTQHPHTLLATSPDHPSLTTDEGEPGASEESPSKPGFSWLGISKTVWFIVLLILAVSIIVMTVIGGFVLLEGATPGEDPTQNKDPAPFVQKAPMTPEQKKPKARLNPGQIYKTNPEIDGNRVPFARLDRPLGKNHFRCGEECQKDQHDYCLIIVSVFIRADQLNLDKGKITGNLRDRMLWRRSGDKLGSLNSNARNMTVKTDRKSPITINRDPYLKVDIEGWVSKEDVICQTDAS